MGSDVLWLISGLALIIAELATGTFYLLVLGVGALAGSAVAFAGGNFALQSIATCVVSIAAVFLVKDKIRKKKSFQKNDNNMDIGQPVFFEAWVNQEARLARVKYRGASWDAKLIDDAAPESDDVLYVVGSDGSQLQLSSAKPE